MKIIVPFMLGAALAGCKDTQAGSSGIALGKLGLVMAGSAKNVATADAPGTTWTSGPPDASIRLDKVTVDVAKISSTIDAAKAELQKHPNLDGRPKREPTYTFKRFTKEQTIDGGWHLEYEIQSPLDSDDKPTYGVLIQRTIDGTVVQCGQNTWQTAYRDAIVAACLSLKKK